MNNEHLAPGFVFISYAREDVDRATPLVDYLAQSFIVWWDADIEPGTDFRSTIAGRLEEAACVVVIWTTNSVESRFVRSEAARVQDRGILVPVKLDANARIPLDFDQLQYVDLSAWSGSESRELQRLVARLKLLVDRGTAEFSSHGTLSTNDRFVEQSNAAASELGTLTARLHSIGEILISGSNQSKDLEGTLKEVGNTYRAVTSAIMRFVSPAMGKDSIDPAPYVQMERGTLVSDIRNGRGHCGRILSYYGRHGGLRDWLKNRLDPRQLQEVDKVFARLGTADGDLFRELAEVGEVLTNESRAIVNLLVAEQEAAARRRIIDGRTKLQPIEQRLESAMHDLQQLQTSPGYAESA
jgi:hypothetical protein